MENVTNERTRAELDARIEEGEIKRAVFQLDATKAPGPDGYNGLFYQSQRDITRADLISAVMSFFSTEIFPDSLNSTDITLIPKVIRPEDPSQFRPISLCNFAYKIISKVDFISCQQSAFISGGQMQGNKVVSFIF